MPAKSSPGLTALRSLDGSIPQDLDQDLTSNNSPDENTEPDLGNPFAEDIPPQDSTTDNPGQIPQPSNAAAPAGQDTKSAGDESDQLTKPVSTDLLNQPEASEAAQDDSANQPAGIGNDESIVAVPGAPIPANRKNSLSAAADTGLGDFLWLVWILIPLLLAIVIWRVWSVRRRKAAYEKIYKSIADERNLAATSVDPEDDFVNTGLIDRETAAETPVDEVDALATVESNLESTVAAGDVLGEEQGHHLNPEVIIPSDFVSGSEALDDDDVMGIGDDELDSDEFDFDADDDFPPVVTIAAETGEDNEDSSDDADFLSMDEDDDDFASLVDDSDDEFDFSADDDKPSVLTYESQEDSSMERTALAADLTDVTPGLAAASNASESDFSNMESQFPDNRNADPVGLGPALKTVQLAQTHDPQAAQSTTGELQQSVDQQLRAELSVLRRELEQVQNRYDALAVGHQTELQRQRQIVDSLQAEKTKLQCKLEDVIKENESIVTESSSGSRDLASIQMEVENLKIQLTGLQSENDQLSVQLAAANTRVEELDRTEIDSVELGQQLQQALDDLTLSNKEKLAVAEQLTLTEERLESAQQRIRDVETTAHPGNPAVTADTEMEAAGGGLLAIERQKRFDAEMMLEQAEEQRTEVATKLGELRRELKDLRNQVTRAAHEGELEAANAQLSEAESVNAELLSKLESQEKSSNELTEQFDDLKRASAATDSQVSALEKELASLRTKLEDDSEVQQLVADRDRLKADLETAANNLTDLAAEKSGLQSELSSSNQVAQQLRCEIEVARENFDLVRRQAEEKLAEETGSLRSELDRLRQKQQRQLTEANLLERSFNDVTQKNNLLEDNARARESELHQLRQQLIDVRQEVAAAENDRNQIEVLQSSLRLAEGKIQQLREHLEENRQLAEQVDSPGQPLASANPEVANPGLGNHASDDLTKISGIDARLSEILRDSGIRTYANLSAAKVGDLRKILGIENLPGCDPKLWKKQATLAKNGKWKKLLELQDELNRDSC